MGYRLSPYGVQLSPYAQTHIVVAPPMELILAAAAGASATHASVAGAAAGHDGSAGGAGGCVAHVVHGLHGVCGVVDAAIFDRGVVSCEL